MKLDTVKFKRDTPPMTRQNSPHHHGDLRAALIAAGIDMLEADGIAGLSLRKIAARVGVSHAAPAHHFNGKNALLVAIAAQGFRTFTDLMRQGRKTPLQILKASLLDFVGDISNLPKSTKPFLS